MEADAAAPDLPAGPWAGHFANPYAFEVGDLVWIGDDRPVAAAFNIPPRQQVKIVRRARYMGNPIYDLAALDGDIIAEDVEELTLGRTKEDVEAIHPHTTAAAAAIEADAAAAAAAPAAAMEPEAQDPAEDAVPLVHFQLKINYGGEGFKVFTTHDLPEDVGRGPEGDWSAVLDWILPQVGKKGQEGWQLIDVRTGYIFLNSE
jgi:hypothetical protein